MLLSLNVGCVVTGHRQWWQDREPLSATASSCGQLSTPVSVTYCCITTTPKTRALEQELSVFAPTSVDLQGFCASTLGLVGMTLLPTSRLWSRSTHISYSEAKAGRPAATHEKVFSWQQQRLEMLSEMCETSYGLELEHCHSCWYTIRQSKAHGQVQSEGAGKYRLSVKRPWREGVDAELGAQCSLLEPLLEIWPHRFVIFWLCTVSFMVCFTHYLYLLVTEDVS